jgi:hypothetical protein
MAATLRAEVSVTLSIPTRERSGFRTRYHTALAYLCAFLVAHHSVIADIDGPTSFSSH